MKLFFSISAGVLAIAVFCLFITKDPSKKKIAPSVSNHFRVNLADGDPPSLHPHRSVDARGRSIGKALFEGLTRIKSKQVILAAADKVEINPTYTHFRFSIRPHYWTNGQKVTAYHFEKAWKMALRPDARCSRADLFYIIKNARRAKCNEVPLEAVGIRALDETTLTVELEHPAPYFLELISHSIFSPVYGEDEEPTIFNGPFVLGNWKHGSLFELDRNCQYWDAENVGLQKVSISMIMDLYTEFFLFEKGEYDLIGESFDAIPDDLLVAAKKDPRFHTEIISRVYWLYMNTETFPFQSAWIRKAFAYAIDRKNLIQNFLVDDIPSLSVLPKTLTLLDEASCIEDGNTEKAIDFFEQGLKELGLTRETFPSITISYCTYGSQKALTQIFQESLKRTFGIDVQIQAFEWNILSDHLAHGQFQLASCLRNAIYEDPSYFLEIFKDKNGSYNSCRWENKTYQQLLAQANSAKDMKEREHYLRLAEKLLIEEMPVIPIYTETCKYLLNEKLKGYSITPSGYVDFKNLFFDKS